MITPASYEDAMQMNEESGNLKSAIKDTVIVLKQYGFDAGANILERITRDDIKTDGRTYNVTE